MTPYLFENHWDLLLRKYSKKKSEKETKILTTHKTLMKAYRPPQNISYDIISIDMLIFELHRIEWDLSVMRIRYKLTIRTTKTEKFEKFMKTELIKNFDYSL